MSYTFSIQNVLAGLRIMVGLTPLLSISFGVLLGLVFGVLPGLGGIMAMVLLLPFTINLPPAAGLGMLVGIFVAGCYGGALTSITLGIPGSPVAAATLLDGHPMAKKGKAAEAIGWAILASTLGGIFSGIVLVVGAPVLANVALRFGPPEFFALGIMGLSTIASVSRESTGKGLVAACLGLFLATIGTDELTAQLRFTLGIPRLYGGIPLIATLMGLFAGSEILAQARSVPSRSKPNIKLTAKLPRLREVLRHWKTLLKSSIIGTFIGVVPGTGGVIATYVSYGEARRSSKTPEKFGTGIVEGVIATEAANNSMVGGALVPTLSLGIPGDAASALLIGALMLHGISAGPRLFTTNPDLVSAVFVGFIIANVAMLAIGLVVGPLFAGVLRVPRNSLLPIIFILSFAGTFAVRSSFFDTILFCIFGLLGYAMKRNGYPLAPVVIGRVLGPIVERSFRRSLILSDGSPLIFVTRPVSIIIWLLVLILMLYPLIGKLISKSKSQQ